MSDDEIDILWHGEWALARTLERLSRFIAADDIETLTALMHELKRIRILRVQRQSQRRRAKQRRVYS